MVIFVTDRLLTTGEAAKALGISARTLARWAQDGTVTAQFVTAGGHYRFDLEKLRQQLKAINVEKRGTE